MQTSSLKRYFENPEFNLIETSVVLLRSSFMNHEAAISLNEAYHLNLTRIDDLKLENRLYPVYIYHNATSRMSFILIAAPIEGEPNPCFDYYDKILFIRGRDAKKTQRKIYDDLSLLRPEPPASEILQHKRWELLNMLHQGIFEPATLNFIKESDDVISPVTSLFNGPEENMPRKLHTQIKQLKDFFTKLYSAFEWHLSNPVDLDLIERGLDGSEEA